MKRKNEFLLRDLGNEKILVPLGKRVIDINGLITMNATAAFVWEFLSEDHSFDEIVTAISRNFDIRIEQASTDFSIFLDQISNLKIIDL